MRIHHALLSKSISLIHRHEARCAEHARRRRQFRLRTGETPEPRRRSQPEQWLLHPHFDPFYVRSRADKIADGIEKRLLDGAYDVEPILQRSVPKNGGGVRRISILPIPDAVVAATLAKRLIARNAHLFSSYSFAYRPDRNAHHAIQHLSRAIKDTARAFVVEFDFKSYFDSVEHAYLLEVMKNDFNISRSDRRLIETMLSPSVAASADDYKNARFTKLERGLPQGSALSLFLANVACHQLDHKLERTGAIFARFSDDTVIVCDSYDAANRCAKLMLDHGKRSGTEINPSKSDGVSLLSAVETGEMKTKRSVTFLSHQLTPDGIGVSDIAVDRIKRRVRGIIHAHLLRRPLKGRLNPDRLGDGFVDWDLVNCVQDLRDCIYGARVSEAHVEAALRGEEPFRVIRSVLSFYPTVEPAMSAVFKGLDGWLADFVNRAYGFRCKTLKSQGLSAREIPKDQLIQGSWYRYPSVPVETKLPSFYRAWLYCRRSSKVFGLRRFPAPGYYV